MSLGRKRFLRNVAALQAGGALYSGMNFASGIVLAHVLGAGAQGSWIVANQLYALLFFAVNVGLLQVAVTQIASASARGSEAKVGAWLACLAKAYLAIGAALVVAGWFALPAAVELWRRGNPSIDPRVGTWAWCLLFTPLLDVPRVTALAAFQGTRRMVRLTQVENAGEVMRAFLVIAGAIVTGSPWGPVVGALTGTALASGVAVALYRRAERDRGAYPLPGVRIIVGQIRGVPLRAVFRQGLQFGVVRQTDALARKILPPLIIQTFGSSRYVAYFRIAQGIMDVPLMFMQGVSRAALPALSELRGLKDHARFRSLFRRTTWIGGTLISLGVAAALPLVPFLLRLLPADYRGPVWSLCLILALAAIPVAFAITLDSFYLLTGRLRVAVRIALAGFAVAVPATAFLTWRFPETGAAWGLVITSLVAFAHFAYVRWFFRHDPELADGRPGPGREATAV